MKCWGGGEGGKLGYHVKVWRGNTFESVTNLGTVNLGTGRTAKAIAAGGAHTCAILANDSVKCWGGGGVGQLGYDDQISRGNTLASMKNLGTVNLGTGRTAKAISAGP